MPGIGDTLREARMRRKIDITDVEAATKIRAKYLRALENEEFDLLHGSTFVRSFLRTYAHYLGLDAQRLIEEYRARYEPRDELLELPPIAPRPQSRRPEPRGGGPPGRGVIAGGVVVALLAFLLILGLTGDDGDEGEVASPAEETTERERPAERQGRRRQRPERRPVSAAVRVRVSPTRPVYVCWDRGPGTDPTEISTLSAPRTFRGRRIRLNLGNPSAQLSVGGRRVPLEGSGPFGFDIRRGEVDEVPLGERPCA